MTKLYRRTWHPALPGGAIRHPRFAADADKFVRSYLVILQDVCRLFEYVEPADDNLKSYGIRIHQILNQICIEIEANFKAILSDNGMKTKNINMNDFKLVDKSHFLSDYKVKMPHWIGVNEIFCPFHDWKIGKKLSWHQAYNASKHERHAAFSQANFGNLLAAFSGLLALITAQFGLYVGHRTVWGGSVDRDGFTYAIGDVFFVRPPNPWPVGNPVMTDEEIAHIRDRTGDPFHNFSY